MAAEPKAKATSRYALRKAARLRGARMTSRASESPPWYCWPRSRMDLEAKIERYAVTLYIPRHF